MGKKILSAGIYFSLLMIALLFHNNNLIAQKSKQEKKQAAIKALIDSQNYVFKAQSAMPMSGATRQLNYDYDLKVSKDTINSYLPYYGRAYTAPMDPTQGGIHFISKDFEYTVTPGKKQGWDIVIKPKDVQDVQMMSLSVSSDGYATLQVTSTSKQPISFNGIIVERKTKKKK
ncbi:DUF4251 domain-containing protein [Pinibacter aurantiacus]|uniref:DUF4251 domain-containing protein n=1 Tax=Pinibacter aurantiacus TaxID=2851599 RepID=A0A9E2SAT1_9BACT|nr:DUF4251 domain-containing protein [Pinibacter aurantiacus]MBV4357779.1 DUF4251 domain-containing protein [Pinibacter aurantiacus]